MREILFRGVPTQDWNKHFFADIWKDNCKGNFVYGSLIVSKDRYYICVSALCKINSCINNGITSMIEVIPETVGQYTGLTDNNGTKIFEGDIVKVCRGKDVEIGAVKCDERFAAYIVSFDKGKSCLLFFDIWQGIQEDNRVYIEVIGNIHDNPELLKGGEG